MCIFQVFYSDEDTDGQVPWTGTVLEDRRRGAGRDLEVDPYGAGGLWERYRVAWDTAEPTLQSPWELYEAGAFKEAVTDAWHACPNESAVPSASSPVGLAMSQLLSRTVSC